MSLNIAKLIKKGSRILYDDGRPGHRGVEAVVLSFDAEGMTVLFEDRADTNYVRFSDPKWVDFISVVE